MSAGDAAHFVSLAVVVDVPTNLESHGSSINGVPVRVRRVRLVQNSDVARGLSQPLRSQGWESTFSGQPPGKGPLGPEDGPSLLTRDAGGGPGVGSWFGPYVWVQPGRYEVLFQMAPVSTQEEAVVTFSVTSDSGRKLLAQSAAVMTPADGVRTLALSVHLTEPAQLEFPGLVAGGVQVELVGVSLTRNS